MGMSAFLRILQMASFVLLLALTACTSNQSAGGEPLVSRLSEEQATEVVENALQGYNTADYAMWSRDWSDSMKSAIKETHFLAFREQLMQSHGQYVSVAQIDLAPGKEPGYIRWVAICNFERGQVRFNFAFAENGNKVEGVFPEAVS